MLDFLVLVKWLDGSPILPLIEPYRRKIFWDVLDSVDDTGRMTYNLALLGRGKKNCKSLDLVLAALFACVANDPPRGNDIYLIANDEGQANDDLSLCKKLVAISPHLLSRLVIRDKMIVRKDNRGTITILPGRDAIGLHGKTYRAALFDEIHGYRDWALLEALALDPHRDDSQMILTSYASVFHKPGVPLLRFAPARQSGR